MSGSIRGAGAFVLLSGLLATHAGAAVGDQGQGTGSTAPTAEEQLEALRDEGQVIYSRECASCHGADGTGDGAGPALVADMALANKQHVIKRILEGSADQGMDPFAGVLNDRQVAAVSTFVRNAWENTHGVVLEADVKPLRDQIKKK